jgi:hypothetical protein
LELTFMRAPALALTWQLCYRHRLALLLMLAGWVACAIVASSPSADGTALAGIGGVAVAVTVLWLAAAFAYGFDGIPLERRESGFPARQFTLPARTGTLVAVPMLAGSAAVTLAWAAWALGVFRPVGADVPVLRPALEAAAVLAWVQAVLWTPFGLPWVRLVLALLAPSALLLLGALGPVLDMPEPVLAALFAALLPSAYLVAWRGVRAARHGDVPDWTGRAPAVGPAVVLPAARPPFASPVRAQLWYEWRQNVLTLPVLLVGLFLPLTLVAMLLARVGGDAIASEFCRPLLRVSGETRTLVAVLHLLVEVPPFLAAVMSFGLGSLGPRLGTSPFLLTRPLGSGAFVTAKLHVAARSTLASMGVIVLTAVAWLTLTHTWPLAAAWWDQVIALYQPGPACGLVACAVVGFVGLIWLLLCQGFVIGLLCRRWAYVVPLIGIVGLFVFPPVAQWLRQHPAAVQQLVAALPAVLGVVAVLKAAAVVTALREVLRRRLWGLGTVAAVLGVWLLTAGCLVLLAACLVPTDWAAWYVPPLVVVLALPLARILAAPLSLDWGRHE